MAQEALRDESAQEQVELLSANTVDFDEAGLADASISGDTQAFESLYTHYFPKVRGFCLRKLGNADLAEDIAQEAFARAFERITDFGGPRHFGGWVGTIAANLCTDHLRRKKNMPVPLEDPESGPSYEVDPIRNLQRQDTGRLVRLALDKLEPRHREALLLHEVSGMSCAAVGRRLGISEVAAESLLARARRRLRKEITAKAAPADLFGLGGLGLLPSLVRGWRRAREGFGRRVASVQAAARGGLDTVSAGFMPSLDAAKALMFVVGAALVVEAAAGNAVGGGQLTSSPLRSENAAAGPSLLVADGDLGFFRTAGEDTNVPVRANVDPYTGRVDITGGAAIKAPDAADSQGTGGVDLEFSFQGNLPNYKSHARVVVTGQDGSTIADTGDIDNGNDGVEFWSPGGGPR